MTVKLKNKVNELINNIEQLTIDIQNTPSPSIENSFDNKKIDLNKKLLNLKLQLSGLVKDYMVSLNQELEKSKEQLGSVILLQDNKLITSTTNAINSLADIITSESDRLSGYIQSPSQIRRKSSLQPNIKTQFDEVIEFQKQRDKGIKRRQEKRRKEQLTPPSPPSPKKQLKRFKFKLNNFKYILITKGIHKGSTAEIHNYNPNTDNLYVYIIPANIFANIKFNNYMFIKNINGKLTSENLINPKYVDHNVPSKLPFKIRTEFLNAGEDQKSPLSSAGSVMSLESLKSPEFQATFEQERDTQFFPTKVSNDVEILTDMINLLNFSTDSLNPFEIATQAEIYKKSIDYDIKSKTDLKLFLATVLFVYINNSRIAPLVINKKCKNMDWNNIDYIVCVLEKYILNKKVKKGGKTIDIHKKINAIIKLLQKNYKNLLDKRTTFSKSKTPEIVAIKDIPRLSRVPLKFPSRNFMKFPKILNDSTARKNFAVYNDNINQLISEIEDIKISKSLPKPPPKIIRTPPQPTVLKGKQAQLPVFEDDAMDIDIDITREKCQQIVPGPNKTKICNQLCPSGQRYCNFHFKPKKSTTPKTTPKKSTKPSKSKKPFDINDFNKDKLPPIEKLTVLELKQVAKIKNISNISKLKKQELIDAINLA